MNKDVTKIEKSNYTISWINYEEVQDENDSNLDVHVKFKDGARFVATFFTVKNIQTLFEKNRLTKECAKGTYFWAANMILINNMSEGNISKTIEDLIKNDEFILVFDGPFFD